MKKGKKQSVPNDKFNFEEEKEKIKEVQEKEEEKHVEEVKVEEKEEVHEEVVEEKVEEEIKEEVKKEAPIKEFVEVPKETEEVKSFKVDAPTVERHYEDPNVYPTTNSSAKYRSFNSKLVTDILLFIVAIVVFSVLLTRTFYYSDEHMINYSENKDVDYKVYLKDNEFYDEEYLGKDMLYVASLIDYIDIDFNYLFDIDNELDMSYDYKVIGNLVIENASGDSKYFEKPYTLLGTQTKTVNHEKEFSLDQEIKVDYDYYNSLANRFKTSFGVDAVSYLDVQLIVNKKSNDEDISLNNSSELSLKIPLSERAIEINFDSNNSRSADRVLVDKHFVVNYALIPIDILILAFGIYVLIRLVKLLLVLPTSKSKYDIFIEKVLREYDRFIVETSTGIDESVGNITKIDKFDELLDVRDNLKLPIMYYNIAKHQKCYFYIKNNDDIYIFKLKAVDLENESKDKK